MSTALEPVIQSRLEQFRRRRQLLQLARGLAWAVTTALVVLLAVVIIDASIVMGQAWRWLLSLMIYGSLLAWLLATCRRVWRRETLPRTASLVEQLEPKFREQLVSAVELSQDTTANRLSSAGFRARLQQQVARAIEPVSMRKLLPWSLVARALVFAILALVACMSLSLVPQLHWPHRVARALLPGANLGRISRFQIEILAPQPATTCLPLGDVAAIEARVLGAVPSNVWLETRLSDSGERQAMRGVARGSDTGRLALPRSASAQVVEIAAEDLIYAANLTLTAEDLEYRVVADDAHTPWYRLTTQPRPQAVQFIKQLRFPDYSGLPSQQLSDSHGDIQALRGTSVRLEVVCDSAIERGWLEWQPAEEATAKRIDLQPVSSSLAKRLTAELRIDTDANYRVHLEAAQTHFTNAFSPEYQVRALVDQPPRLAWQQPQTNMLVVEPNQLVPLEVQIQDELPLAELALFTSINGEPAVQTAVAPPDQAEATAKVELDLLTARPKIGDTIRLLFQGTDRQGQSTSTPPIELIVSSTAVDPQRRPATEGRLELASELRRLSEQVTPQLKRVRELNDQISKQADTEATAELAATAKELAANAGTTAKALREKVMTQLKLPQDAVSLAELERTGQVLARIESQLGQAVTTAVAALEDPAAEQSKQPAVAARERAGRVRTAVEQLGDATSVLDRRFREFVAHDVLSEIARGLHVVQDYQQQLASAAEDITPAQLRRRQAIVARQLRELEQVMIDRSPLLREAAAHGLRGWIDWTGQLAERIERASADTDDNPNFKQFTKQVLNEVNQHQGVMSVDSGLASEINNGRKELDARSQSSAGILKNLAQQLAQSANQSAADPAAASAQPAAAMERLAQESVAYLQQRKELQQARSDSDAQFTSDLGNALRATKKITSSASVEPSTAKQQLIAAAAALQRLEAVHNVAEANDYLKALEQTERWNASSVEASTESPRAWDALQQRLEQAARALREAGVESKLASAVDALRGTRSSTEAAQKITARRWSSETHVSAEAELAELRQRFDDTLAQLDLVAAAARQELNGMAPQIPELARQAAEETRQLQQSTEQLVRAAASGEVPDLKPRLDQIQAEQQQTVGPINDLRDALGEMAATQNLLQADQRAAARDADTSQQILDKATEHMAEALKPAESASSPAAAAGPLEQAAKAQGETRQALEQIAEHFAKLQSGASPDAALAESRQSLSELAQELDMSAMEQWYQTAESLSQLAGIDPQQVLKRLEEELNRNVRMREELSQLAKQALKESVDTLNYSANQERSLQSQLEQSDPAFYQKKNLLQQDIQAATERMKLWMQQLSSDASAVAGRAGARDQQKALSDLQQQLQQTIDQSTPATIALPLTELQQIADKVTQNLQAAEKQFDALAEQLDANSDDPIHANDQELRNRRREMQDWQRRSLLQQSRGAQAIERSHEQRLRQADNARRNADSLLQNAQRQLSELEKKAEKQPDNESLQRQVADANKNIQSLRNELSLAEGRQQSLKLRHERAKQTQVEYAARKVDDLESKNPTAELAGRLSENAANTSRAIAEELRSALTDSGWMQQLAAAQSQLQAGGQTQQRVEQAVGGVAENLRRASRHETRLEHPLMAESIATQAARVEQTGQKEVHTAAEQLAAAADAAKAQMAADAIERATADASLTARSAIHAAEGGLRDRAQDLEQVLAETGKETAKPAEPELPLPAAPSVPLDPKMLARMLDELDRQASEAASNQPQESNEAQNQTPGQNGQPQDDNNQASSQQSSPSSKQRGAQSASMQQAAKQISQQLNQQRSQNRQSTASSRMSSNSADTKPQPPSSVRVLDVDRRAGEDWGKLREQAAEETLESARQTIAPQYRQSVETYFRVLSERGQRGGAP